MARATYSGIGITDLKGSIAGTTFQHNSSGKIVRQRPRIISKFSVNQNNKQILLSNFCRKWHQLSNVNKALWAAFATAHTKFNFYNEVKILTGFNWYTSINSYRYICGLTTLSPPPVYTVPAAVNDWSLLVNGNGIFICFASEYEVKADYLLIYSSPYLSNYSATVRNKFLFTHIIKSGFVQVIDITSAWETAHNTAFPSYNDFFNFNISVILVNCCASSGQVSLGSIHNDMLSSEVQGIGQMIIQNNFIIT
jgi:hypothetical protein